MTGIQVLAVIPVVVLLVFYVWMFREMVNDDALPPGTFGDVSWPPVTRTDWFLVFIVLNVFGAALYYSTRYRRR